MFVSTLKNRIQMMKEKRLRFMHQIPVYCTGKLLGAPHYMYSQWHWITKDNHKIKLFILYYMYTKHNGYMIDFKCVRRIFLNDLWIKHSVKNLFFNFYLCIFTIRVLSLIYLDDKKLISLLHCKKKTHIQYHFCWCTLFILIS